jgi:hypothetical protein
LSSLASLPQLEQDHGIRAGQTDPPDSGQTDPPDWAPHPEFSWLPRGVRTDYLGCKTGIDLAPDHEIAPLLQKIRQKPNQMEFVKIVAVRSHCCSESRFINHNLVFGFLLDLLENQHQLGEKGHSLLSMVR